MGLPPKDPTKPTPPLDQSVLALPPSDPVIALRVLGDDIELTLSPERDVFTLGALPPPAVDLSLPLQHVSRVHCTIHRRGNRLHIADNELSTGLFIDDQRTSGCEIRAGQVFRLGDVRLLALDNRLRDLRPLLLRVLSLTDTAKVDTALADIASGDRMILIGRGGCDQALLAEAIHRASSRRSRAFVHVRPPLATDGERHAVLRHAQHGTAFVDLDELSLTAPFVTELFGTTYHIRPIFAATTYKLARQQLGEDRARLCREITIPTLGDRTDEIGRLLDAIFVDELKTSIVPSQLARLQRPLDRLATKRFPQNFDDLRKDAIRIYALIRHDFDKAATADEVGISTQGMDEWASRLGL